MSSVTSAPDHVRAQELAGLGVEDGLDEALGLAQRDGLAVADEGEAADADLVADLLGARLGVADARHLRMAVGAARDGAGLDRVDVLAAIMSATMTPSCDALCASQGAPATSPMA
jgi:hypothetical protein